MKILNNERLKLIESYIKNGKDISSLLDGYSLKNQSFARAVIKKLNRFNEDLSGTNFAYCTIGENDTETNLSGCNLKGCNFKRAKFLGRTIIRNADVRNCNFHDTDLNHFEYQNSDFRGGVFCGCVLKIGTDAGQGAIVDSGLIELLKKGWILK